MTREAGLLVSVYAVYLTAVVSPGPNTFIVTRHALAEGRRPATRAVLGVAAGNALWLLLTLAGAHLLLARVPGLTRALAIGGSVWLGGMGVRTLHGALRGGDLLTRAGEPPPSGSPVRAGLFTSLTNPNTLPFYLSLLGATVAPSVPVWVRFASAAGVLVLCLLWYGTLAWSFSSDLVQAAYRRWARWVNLLLAVLLIGFAVRLVLPVI